MKKIIAVMLISILGLCVLGCTDEKTSDTTDGQTSEQSQTLVDASDSLTDKVDSYVAEQKAALGETTSEGDLDAAGQTDVSVADGDGSFTSKDDTVYATTNVVVRNKPSTEGDPVMNLGQGESAHRVGYSETWTKIEYNGYYYYIATRYLTETP